MKRKYSDETPKGKSLFCKKSVRFNIPQRAVLGVVQLETNLIMDKEGAIMIACIDGVEIRFTEMKYRYENPDFETYYRAYVSGAIENAIKSLCLPEKNNVTQWGIPCMSISSWLGPERLRNCFPNDTNQTDMCQGVLAALSILTADRPSKRLAIFTPYTRDLSLSNHNLLKDQGYSIEKAIYLDLEISSKISTIELPYVAKCVVGMCATTEVDVVIIECSSLRCCMPGFISLIENKIRVPVVTSTQAFMWHMLREAGIYDKLEGYGKLLKL